MYELDKKNCMIILATTIVFFSIAGTSSALAEKFDDLRDYGYLLDYDYDYQDDSFDRSDYDQDTRSYTDLEDITQKNENGDNIIIVENKQESIVDKAKNLFHEIMGDEDQQDQDYRNSDYYTDNNYNYETKNKNKNVNVIVAFSHHYKKSSIPDIKITSNGKSKNLDSNDLKKSADGYLIFETNFKNLNQNTKVCISPIGAPKDFSTCKNVGDQKTVRFFVS